MRKSSQTIFLKYYLQYYEKIYRYLYFRAYENKSLAEDLTSETFLKALEKFETFDREKGFSSWIYAIARNCLIDYVRKQKNRGGEVSLEDQLEFLCREEGEMLEAIDAQFARKKILESLKNLSEKQRELILLKYFDQLENKEIVQMLGIDATTLRVQQHRALKKLKTLLPPTFFIFLFIISNVF